MGMAFNNILMTDIQITLIVFFFFFFFVSYYLTQVLMTSSEPPEGLLGGSGSKDSACNAGDLGLISGSGRFPREGHGNPLQYSCLENSMDRGVWQATVYEVAESATTE